LLLGHFECIFEKKNVLFVPGDHIYLNISASVSAQMRAKRLCCECDHNFGNQLRESDYARPKNRGL